MTGSAIISIGFLVLVILGTGIVCTQSTWRETIAGLSIQYVGAAALIGLTSGPAAAVVGVIAGGGVTLLLANAGYFSHAAEIAPAGRSRTIRARAAPVARDRTRGNNRWTRSVRQIEAGLQARPFDASVFALAAVGSIALALTRPLFGSIGADGAVNILLIGGVLGCLLGGEARVAGALLFILSAGSIGLHAAERSPPAGESILLASAQIALALALVYLRSLDPGPADRVGRAVASNPGSDEFPLEEPSAEATSERAVG